MGTNYYAEVPPCPTCGHVITRTHIGKCSGGWPFLFRRYEMHPTNYQEWLKLLSDPRIIIRNEYGDIVSLQEFIDTVDYFKKYVASVSPEYERYYYYDNEGYRFSYTEFS